MTSTLGDGGSLGECLNSGVEEVTRLVVSMDLTFGSKLRLGIPLDPGVGTEDALVLSM